MIPNAYFVLTSCVELTSCCCQEAMRVFTRFCSYNVSHISRISLATAMNTTAFCILETVGQFGREWWGYATKSEECSNEKMDG
jgi:hypothetical protein